MKTSESINELAKALAAAQGEMGHAVLNKINPHFKSKYADLAEIINATKILAKHGIAVVQGTGMREWGLACVTRFMHSSGQWMESEYPLPMAPDKPQVMASAYTYARRYGRAGMSGIAAEEDDDGSGTSKFTKSNGEDVGIRTLPKKDAKEIYDRLQVELNSCKTTAELVAWGKRRKDQILILPDDWADILHLKWEERKLDLRQAEPTNGRLKEQLERSIDATKLIEDWEGRIRVGNVSDCEELFEIEIDPAHERGEINDAQREALVAIVMTKP